VETRQSIDALKRVREEGSTTPGTARPDPVAQRPASTERPNPSAKFEASTKVEGDIASVVGGATDKPVPPPPKKIEPKGAVPQGPGASLGGLMAAKKRAQEQIRKKEEGQP
jgi:hypothetical protein